MVPSRLVAFLFLLLFCGAAWAQRAACATCRQEALDSYSRCQAAAQNAAERAACNAAFADMNRACFGAACADETPRASNPCEDCRNRAAVEEARCMGASAPNTPARWSCERRVEDLRDVCRSRFCR